MLKPDFKYVHDLTPAKWIYDRLDPCDSEKSNQLSIFIPKEFESYLAIRHDNALTEEDAGVEIDWEIFTKNLLPFTSTQDDCFFGLWDGYGIHFKESQAELFERIESDQVNFLEFPYQRNFYLFNGTLLDSLNLNFNDPGWMSRVRPNISWPADKSWIYFNEIDFEITLLGGSEELISSIESNPLYKTERFLPETLIRDIYLVAPWNEPDLSTINGYEWEPSSIRSKLSNFVISLGFRIGRRG